MRARLFSSFASHLIITMTTTELTNDLVLQVPLAVGTLQWGTTPLDEYVIDLDDYYHLLQV